MVSIAGLTAVFQISVEVIFPVPVQIQGFASDDAFDSADIEPNEVLPGVDGRLSGGRVYVPTQMTIILQADSASNAFFDQWNASEKALSTTFNAFGLVSLPALGTKWTLTKGFLTQYKPFPQVKKLIQPRHYRITWEDVSPAPV